MVRVRFAPSPTGYLHIGGARTALFNWLFARNQRGRFILRIEDTDLQRSRRELVETILEGLRWLGLDWDEGPDKGGDYGPYFQSQRKDIYKNFAEKLFKEGKAYPCYCTPEELAERRKEMIRRKEPPRYDGRCRNLTPEERREKEREGKPRVLRFRWEDGIEGFEDEIHGFIDFREHRFDDFVIMKADGNPTYNFACVVDDHLMEITHVIRGDDHITNTPRQLALYQALGWDPPRFAHLPLILGPDRSRLSKRHGAVDILEYRRRGYLPEALVNYIALLGWSPDSNEEILSREELIKRFSLQGITKRNAIFNLDKLNWMNGQYIQNLTLKEWMRIGERYLENKEVNIKEKDEEWRKVFFEVYQVRVKNLAELWENARFFFDPDYPYEESAVEKVLKKDYVPTLLKDLKKEMERIPSFTIEGIEKHLRKVCEEKGMSGRKFIHPLRVALTGKMVSPPIFHVVYLLGREECIRRIERTLKLLKAGYD